MRLKIWYEAGIRDAQEALARQVAAGKRPEDLILTVSGKDPEKVSSYKAGVYSVLPLAEFYNELGPEED